MCVSITGLGAAAALRPEGKLVGGTLSTGALRTSSAKAAEREEPEDKTAATSPAKDEAAPASEKTTEKEAAPAAPPPPKPKSKPIGLAAFGCAASELLYLPCASPASPLYSPRLRFTKKPEPKPEHKPKPEAPPPREEAVPPREEAAPMEAESATAPFKPSPKRGKASKEDDELWQAWLEAVTSLDGQRFYFQSTTRAGEWSAKYAAAGGTLVLSLSAGHGLAEAERKAEWLLYAKPPAKRGLIRELLEKSPVARMPIRPAAAAGGGAEHELLTGKWELCLPALRSVPVLIGALGTPVDSWQASIGLTGPGWNGHSRFARWSVVSEVACAADLDGDISGEYELLPSCGGPCNSLHKRVSGGDGKPLYFFLDPSRTGHCGGHLRSLARRGLLTTAGALHRHGSDDCFVFARTFERLACVGDFSSRSTRSTCDGGHLVP
jgi:hypothetical protein